MTAIGQSERLRCDARMALKRCWANPAFMQAASMRLDIVRTSQHSMILDRFNPNGTILAWLLLIVGLVFLVKSAMKRIRLPNPQVARWATSLLTAFTLLIIPWLLLHRPASNTAALISQPMYHGAPVLDAHGDLWRSYTPDVWPLVVWVSIILGCFDIVVEGTAFVFRDLVRRRLRTSEDRNASNFSPSLNVQFICACLLARALLTVMAHPSAVGPWMLLSLSVLLVVNAAYFSHAVTMRPPPTAYWLILAAFWCVGLKYVFC